MKSVIPIQVESVQASNRTPGVDINAVGPLDRTSIYNINLNSAEDKPWKKPSNNFQSFLCTYSLVLIYLYRKQELI